MTDLLDKAAGLIRGIVPAAGGLVAKEIVNAITARPVVNTGGPTYLTDFPPLMKTDTNKIEDGVKIIDHIEKQAGCKPIVNRVIGDGQTMLTLSYLKRYWPETCVITPCA